MKFWVDSFIHRGLQIDSVKFDIIDGGIISEVPLSTTSQQGIVSLDARTKNILVY